MAEDTTDTRPGNDPGVLKTGTDGELPDLTGRGRLAWVRMQDTDEGGGGRFDVLADRVGVWKRRGVRVVPNYPIHFGPSGRLAAPRTNLRQLTEAPAGGEAFIPRGGPTVGDGIPPAEGEQPPADPTLAQPASELGAVEPADERQPDTIPPPGGEDNGDQADAGEPDPTLARPASELGAVEPARLAAAEAVPASAEETTDQADGEPAAAKTATKRGGRNR